LLAGDIAAVTDRVVDRCVDGIQLVADYVAVAIASGIISTKCPEGLNAQNLTSQVGFRGITGLFRLTPAGAVERKLALYAISVGKLNLIGAAPASF
jgi:hypothetical protein